MGDTTFNDIYNLDDDNFIAGDSRTYEFYVKDANGAAVGITGATCFLIVFPIGQSDVVVLNKAGTITDATNGIWKVELIPSDTLSWDGVYQIQPHITDFDGAEHVNVQGLWMVSPQGQ